MGSSFLLLPLLGVVVLFSAASFAVAETSDASLTPVDLRCEYKSDPLGIDVRRPRLSWRLESDKPDARGQRQTAYEIVVASSADAMKADKGDLWNPGKTVSDETAQIAFAGSPLVSGRDCWWKVRVWNERGQAGAWSKPAHWSMGLLEPGDWKAQWIEAVRPTSTTVAASGRLSLEGCKWIWTNEASDSKRTPEGTRYFRHTLRLAEGSPIKKAEFLLSVDDKFEMFINGNKVGEASSWKQARLIDVTSALKTGENVIVIKATNGAQGPAGVLGKLKVERESGETTELSTGSEWQCSADASAMDAKAHVDWKPATEIATYGDQPWGQPSIHELELPPPHLFRKAFTAAKPIRRATLHATALGLYEFRLNGRRVGEDLLTPGWTDYSKRVAYQTYDVTARLRSGENAIAATLADGWYAGYYGFDRHRSLYGKEPRLLAQLQIEYSDGSSEIIATDGSWKSSEGPLREADLLMGTTYDARRALGGWDAPGFDDRSWQSAAAVAAPQIKLVAPPGDPVCALETLPAKQITEPSPGVYVFDLGQNMVGWVRLKTAAESGQSITLRYSEMLEPDGTLYTTALRGARATDTYVGGGGEVDWQPEFTFHGFRYVEVRGLKEKPSLDAITGIVVHSQMDRSGEFECSSPLVNRLFQNIIWGQKGNYLEVPTDCPQRDERLGWTGDAQFFIPTGAYNFDVSAFFTKWFDDLITDGQLPDATFPDVAPDILKAGGNVAWGDAAIICPYNLYKFYGDTRVIEQHYDAMSRYIARLERTSKDHIRTQGAFGDWLNLGGGAKSEVIGTAYFAHVTRLMSEMAAAIGKKDDAARFGKLSDEVTAAFRREFVSADGSIKDSSQTGYALAFTMNLLPSNVRDAAAKHFVDEIAKKDWHLATGFIGTPRLLPALTAAGRSDVAAKLLLTETFPSWLFQVKLGATTMWERWDGWTPEKGFQDPGMNSFNHYAFGSVGEWMYRTLAGIDTDGAGFKKIIFRPHPVEGLTFAKARYNSIHGEVASEWRIEQGELRVNVTVPINTTATLYLPAAASEGVTEGGKAIGESAGASVKTSGNGEVVVALEPGRYSFTVKR